MLNRRWQYRHAVKGALHEILSAVGVLVETDSDDEGGVMVGVTVELTVEMLGVGKETVNSR